MHYVNIFMYSRRANGFQRVQMNKIWKVTYSSVCNIFTQSEHTIIIKTYIHLLVFLLKCVNHMRVYKRK